MKAILLACTTALLAHAATKVATDLKNFDDKVSDKNAAFAQIPVDPTNREWIKKKLAHMVDVDQYMRKYSDTPFKHGYTSEQKKDFDTKFMKRWTKIDQDNTADLKDLLAKYEWFKISEFGQQADHNAWLLVQHADLDIPFQRKVLTILEKMHVKGESSPTDYAYLYDRVAVSLNDPANSKPQRYGTQGKCIGPGKWEPDPIEDPANVDARRKEVGLHSEAEYIKGFKDICH